jgi:hypothetical protein
MPHMSGTNLASIVMAAREGLLGIDDAKRARDAMISTASSEFERRQAAGVNLALESDLGHRAKAAASAAAVGWNSPGTAIATAIFWDWDTTGVGADLRKVEDEVQKHVNGSLSDRRVAEYALGTEVQYYAWMGDAAGLARVRDRIRRITFPGDTSGFVTEQAGLLLIADAQLAAMTKRPDARALLTQLDSVLKINPQSQMGLYGNAVAARGWELVGEPAKAFAAARREKGGYAGSFYSTQLREEGRLAALAGDREAAMRAYRQYLALRSDPDPALKPQADQVRAELKRLEAGRAR